jgi:dipeptidyl-peptidase-4
MKKGVFLILSLLIVGSVFSQDKKDITLKNIWGDYQFYGKSVSGLRSMNNGVNYTTLEEGNIIKYLYADKNYNDTLVSGKELKVGEKTITINNYEFSSDESKLLIATETKKIYRHSSKSHKK